jgi:DNA (cytosine-5)-methyltransferase 1
MDAIAHALRSLRIPFQHVFTTDPDKAARQHIQNNHISLTHYTYLQQRPFTPTDLDLYCAGPPCQPFSCAGQRPGLSDPRGLLYQQTVDYIRQARPKAFLLENVPGLQTHDKGVHLRHLTALLQQPHPVHHH